MLDGFNKENTFFYETLHLELHNYCGVYFESMEHKLGKLRFLGERQAENYLPRVPMGERGDCGPFPPRMNRAAARPKAGLAST